MNRIVLGGVGALALVGLGMFWWQGRAEVEEGAPPPVEQPVRPEGLPLADANGMVGPAPPEARELTKEQQRFSRYDRDRNWKISRNEMLSTRSDGFRKLDKDGNNLLTFEEWAVTTVDRFEGADANGDGDLTQQEFLTTAPKPAPKKPACKC